MNVTWHNVVDPFPTARGASFATFTTAQDVSPAAPLAQLDANMLKLGSKLELEAWGEFSTTLTPTLQLGFGYGIAAGAAASGGVTLALSAAITTASGAVSFPWHMRWSGIVTAVGTSGAIYGSGILELGTSLVLFSANAIPATAAARAVTIDTTTAKTLNVIAAYGTSSASNAVRVDVFTATVANQNKTG
ncbi:MAG TPA: hypothetical protein VFH54_12610 [Mycobacteriales bacterium]|nr:hypothetical protein [Mycobacteriales bacterium]